MPAVHRQGDANDGGGIIDGVAQGTVYVNGQLASIDGSGVIGHDLHLPTATANGSPTVFIGGISINRQGDADECGHGRADGSPDVFCNDGGFSTVSSTLGNAGAGSTPIPSPVITPPNISNAAIAAVNAAVISTILENAFIAAPAAGLPFDRPVGLKSIPLPATASARAAVEDKIIQTMINSGVIPAAPPSLPFAGGVPPVVATASARMFASLASGIATPEVSNVALAAVGAWYRQKIIDLVPEIKEEILPFSNNLDLNNASASISNNVEDKVLDTNYMTSSALPAIGEAWYTQKIIEAITKDGKLPEEKLLPFLGDDV
jgi:uncharacterized Zn-binding protein involved in type VI secretion